MPAVISDFYTIQSWTETSIADLFRTALEGLGYTRIERHLNGTTDVLDVYSLQVTTGVTCDTVYLAMRFNALNATQISFFPYIARGYTPAATYAAALTNLQFGYQHSTAAFTAFKGSLKSIHLITVSHAEAKFIVCRFPEQNQFVVFGIVRPANKPDYWNENQFLYAFAPATNQSELTTFVTCLHNPFAQVLDPNLWFSAQRWSFFYPPSNGMVTALRTQNLAARRPIINPATIACPGDVGGTFSNEVGVMAGEGLPWLGRFKQSPTEEWTNMGINNTCLALRTL